MYSQKGSFYSPALSARYGVWEEDFRFPLYSLGLIFLSTTEVNVTIDFDDKVSVNDTSSRFFRDCLHPTEQIQEIARAIKWTLDTNYAESEGEEEDEDDDDFENQEELIPIKPDLDHGYL